MVLVEHSVDGNTVVVAGTLDVRCTAELRALVYDAIARQHHTVVDLSAVGSVDMTVVKLLAVASRQAQRQGRRLVLRGCNSGVRRLLHLSHLRGLLAVEPARRRDAPV